MFWLAVGAAILTKIMTHGWQVAAAFLVGFYSLLVGSKAFALLLFREGLRNLVVI
jgi:hypothetical protein